MSSPNRNPKIRSFSDLLGDGRIPVGTVISGTRDPAIAHLTAAAGFDFVWLDMQHSPISIESIADMCLISRLSGVIPIVRVDTKSLDRVRTLLDVGALGIVFFDVRPGQLKTYREWMQEDPISWPTGMLSHDVESEHSHADASPPATIAQIESSEAVENIRTILEESVPDMLHIGRYDLSCDLRVKGQLRHSSVLAAVDSVVQVANEFGVVVAAGAIDPQDASDLLGRGVRCFHYKSDNQLLLEGYRSGLDWLRKVTKEVAH